MIDMPERGPGPHGHGDGGGGSHGRARRPSMTLFASALGISLIQLDFLALVVALPAMASELGTTTTDLQWAISGYMLSLAAMLVPGGRLGDIFGRKRMLVIGLVLFGIASLGGGLSPNVEVVILWRIVQGIGAGIMFPLVVAVITDAYPPKETMRAIGNAYGVGAVALALGPIVGGVLTELLSWRIVLLVNVPLAGVAIAVAAVGIHESRDPTVPRTVDVPGLLAIVAGIAIVTYAVDRAATWGTVRTLVVVALGVLSFVGFVMRERRTEWPLVRLDLFRNAPYVVVTLMGLVANTGLVVMIFASTIYLQQVDSDSPLQAGLILLAASVTVGVAGPVSGRLGERYDIPRTMMVATIIGSVGLVVVSLGGALPVYVTALAVVGAGLGVGWSMASIGTQTVVPTEQAGLASGVTLAIVIGIAGLAVTLGGTLIELGDDLGSAIETLLLTLAIGSAVAAALLGVVAARLTATVPADAAPG
jgi:EmrB/QacA subfamily drug resistance transporter